MINELIIVSRQCLAHDLRKWAGERVDELTIAATGDIPFNLSLQESLWNGSGILNYKYISDPISINRIAFHIVAVSVIFMGFFLKLNITPLDLVKDNLTQNSFINF